jgi:uncharacterized protein YukE
MYSPANTQHIRSGAQRFVSAAQEMQAKAHKLGHIESSLLDGSAGWHGQGADSYRAVMEHLREDLRTAEQAFTQAVGALNVLAMQLDQVNAMHQQAEQLTWQIRSLDDAYWASDEGQRLTIRHEISRLRERRESLLHQADLSERQANQAASAAFDQAGAMANRLHFHHDGESGWKEAATTAMSEVGHFFSKLWDKTKEAAHKVEEAVEEKVEEFEEMVQAEMHMAEEVLEDVREGVGELSEGFASTYLRNATMGLADPLHEELPESRSRLYQMGRFGGDVYGAVEGIVKVVEGEALITGGGAEAVVTSETLVLPAVGIGAMVAGGAVVAAGFNQFGKATSQLGEDWMLFQRADGTEMALKNESLAGKVHPVTEVPFDKDGFPIFEPKFEARFGPDMYQAKDRSQFKVANQQLHDAIQKDPELAGKFTSEQLEMIAKGITPKGYTWHHHQEEGLLQLVNKKVHSQTGHTGGRAIWGGGQENR